MNTVGTKSRSRISTWGWGMLMVINALLIINSAMLYFFIAAESGEQSAAILLAGAGLFGLVLAQEGLRYRSKWAWKISWITAAILLALGVNISIAGELSVGVFYLVLAMVILLGQIMAGRDLDVSKRPE